MSQQERVDFSEGSVIRGDILEPSTFDGLDLFPLIIADPPYGGILSEDWDTWTSIEYLKLAIIVKDLLVKGGSAYIWGGVGTFRNRPFFEFMSVVEVETGMYLRPITWNKKRAYGKKDDYLFTREEIAWLIKGEHPSIFHIPLLGVKRGYEGYDSRYPAKSEYKRRTNVWTDITEVMRGKKHVAEKPERLAEVMIETHTNPGDTVLDLFSGSANVSVVARRMGRKFVAVEGHKETFDKIVERLK